MFQRLRERIDSAILFLDIQFAKIIGDYQYYNSTGFENMMHSTEFDIDYVRQSLRWGLFERERDSFLKTIQRRYSRTYCPNTAFYRYFSAENELEYCYRRVEIDELLRQTGNEYSSDIPTN